MKKRKTKPVYALAEPNQRFTAIGAASLLLLLVLVAYSNCLSGGFHFDDQGIFLDPYILNPGFGWEIFRPAQTRPLTFITFHWNYLLSGPDPFSFHAVNVLIHAAGTLTVMLIARRRLPLPTACVAAALFAIHPLQTQAVNYVFERATLLATLFALVSLLLFLKEKYWMSTAAFGLSLLAKEETVALPVFLLMWNLTFTPRRIPWRFHGAIFALASLAATRLFYVVQTAPDPTLGFRTEGITPLAYLLTQCRVIWIYLRLFVLPYGLNLDHDVRLSQGFLSPAETVLGLVLLLVAAAALGWFAWRKNEWALWTLGFFILLAPSSSIVPVRDVIFEHRTYFPLACLSIATALLIRDMPNRALVASTVLAVLFTTTVLRNRVWHDETSLWTDVVNKSPQKARGYFHLAQASAATDAQRARQLYERGLQLDPANADAWMNLGLVLLGRGDSETAMTHFHKALELGGGPVVWNNLGAAHLRRGETEQAIRSFRRALEGNPCRFDARVNLMRALAHVGDREGALAAAIVPASCELAREQRLRLDNERRLLR